MRFEWSRRFVGILFCLAAWHPEARAFLGGTPAELSAAYGEGAPVGAPPHVEAAHRYATADGMDVQAMFRGGRCVRVAYVKVNWDRTRLERLQERNAGSSSWEDVTPARFFDPLRAHEGRPLRAWRRADAGAFSHFHNGILDFISQPYREAAESVARDRVAAAERARRLRLAAGPDPDAAYDAMAALVQNGGADARAAAPPLARHYAESLRLFEQILRRFPADSAAEARHRTEGRREALAHIERLTDRAEDLRQAHRAHREWVRLQTQRQRSLGGEWDDWQVLRSAIERHARWLRLMTALPPEAGVGADPDGEARLNDLLKVSLGTDRSGVLRFPPPDAPPPAEEYPAELWRYHYNGIIRAYNTALLRRRAASRAEAENIELLNEYREALGLRILELDERLTAAARGHSREMAELNFFSHASPTPANRTVHLRIEAAGYPNPGGENIAMGRTDGKSVFWMWFDSPGHHQNMVRASFVAVGVGNWRDHWTQNFGNGPLNALTRRDDPVPSPSP